MFEDDELKQTMPAFLIEVKVPTTTHLEIKPLDSDKNSLSEFNFKLDQTSKEFIETKMKEELGLVKKTYSRTA